MRPRRDSTSFGTVWSSKSPWPSCPYLDQPNVYMSPSSLTAEECRQPHATDATAGGAGRGAVTEGPSGVTLGRVLGQTVLARRPVAWRTGRYCAKWVRELCWHTEGQGGEGERAGCATRRAVSFTWTQLFEASRQLPRSVGCPDVRLTLDAIQTKDTVRHVPVLAIAQAEVAVAAPSPREDLVICSAGHRMFRPARDADDCLSR